MNILLTNDDGIHAGGIKRLAKIAKHYGNVFIVAPLMQRSQCGHQLTLSKPLSVKQIEKNKYSVDGSPADCVRLGLAGLGLPNMDLVLSGINAGSNLGVDLFVSGTASAAREAAILGYEAVAISNYFVSDNYIEEQNSTDINWDNIESAAKKVLEWYFEKQKNSDSPSSEKSNYKTYWNFNIPALDENNDLEFKICKPSIFPFLITINKSQDKEKKEQFEIDKTEQCGEYIDNSNYNHREIEHDTDVYYCIKEKKITASLLEIKPC